MSLVYRIITLLLVSFSIPLTFMLLLFWRLRKEKKCKPLKDFNILLNCYYNKNAGYQQCEIIFPLLSVHIVMSCHVIQIADLRARAGALVYRETIIVPSYAITNASNDVDDYTNSNVVQMHSTLYDTRK